MTADQIRDALTRQPFEPFDLRLIDGRSFAIHHADYLSVPRRSGHATSSSTPPGPTTPTTMTVPISSTRPSLSS
jgi:hypothetical protein